MDQISVLDMLKIGVGPSSSHTMGPWKAALRFIELIDSKQQLQRVHQISVQLYGSLALTGKGHATIEALILGLSGYPIETVPMKDVKTTPQQVATTQVLSLAGKFEIGFSIDRDIIFRFTERLPYHTNGMQFLAVDEQGAIMVEATYYSIGGGFVVMENEGGAGSTVTLPYPINYARDVILHCRLSGQSLPWIIKENEKVWRSESELDSAMWNIWQVMVETLYRGCHTSGKLPGGLDVSRRAPKMLEYLTMAPAYDSPQQWIASLGELSLSFEDTLSIVSCLAIATNEENADFGRIVTAPTNGAAGVIPAVLVYYAYLNRKGKATRTEIIDFLCVASEIGSIFKKRSTISAAMGGCQAEIGVSSAMAAAALTHGMRGSVEQTLMAAEIAMEHHLGMTCDPVGGLVQIPCIERNSMGAIKAITATQIALKSDPSAAKISLDEVVQTMWETAQDMNDKYKETSLGGLASNYSVKIPEC